jgi:hypothetical protein
MGYKEDYDNAAGEMNSALHELRTAENRVMLLQKRMAALHALIWLDKPEAERTGPEAESVDLSMRVLHATSRPVDQIRRIFARSDVPLTIKELRKELRQVGCDLSEQANPSGTITAVCARLVEQGVVKPTKKDGRKAWEKIL